MICRGVFALGFFVGGLLMAWIDVLYSAFLSGDKEIKRRNDRK